MAENWQNRIVGSGMEPPEQLLANPMNYRTHPPEQRAGVKGALAEIGWVGRVIVNRRTGKQWPKGERNVPTVVDGHLRVELATQSGEPEVPVDYVDLSPNEERLVLATYDTLAGLADTDAAVLDLLLKETTTDDQHLMGVIENLALEAGLYGGDAGCEIEENEVLLDQAIQLKPTREYVVVMCQDGEPGAVEFDALRSVLGLGMVRKGGYKAGSPFDAVGVQRVVHAEFLLELLAGLEGRSCACK